MTPKNKEKHFIVTDMEFDEEGLVLSCCIEAIMSKRTIRLNWHDLKDTRHWAQGWK
ncbi:MAG: TIGR02450 family Trp-rich protein [Paraglaciecola polaris]|uniref:TIGR02450 family Trp-rich protein n=1 Tax=Paraglaciecola polaris TaxID=222814 RepID=UPI0030021706